MRSAVGIPVLPAQAVATGQGRGGCQITPGRRIGYVTDLRYTESNVDVLSQLMQGIDLLYIEGVFLEEDISHAERKSHLTGRQAGEIARRLGAKAIVPVHFSPRYAGRRAELIAEIHAAWRG